MSVTYRKNPNLKGAKVSHKFTMDQVEEFHRCQRDPAYFAEKYVKVIHYDTGIVPFEMRPEHVNFLEKVSPHLRLIANGKRMSGKTTVSWVYALHQMLFTEHANVAILSTTDEHAKHILHQLKLAYEMLPFWMQHGVLEWNKRNIELENGSRAMAAFGGSDALRGHAFTLIMLDEMAFWPERIIEGFWSRIYPTVSSGTKTKVIVTSTPNTRTISEFDLLWSGAESGKNEFVPVRL